MRINTNVSALRAQRSISEHAKQIESASGKISAGTRVRGAADDAASLAIGNKLKSNIRSQSQAIRNANDAVGHFQTAEGAMSEIGNILIRLKELSVQAANGTNGDGERSMLNQEYMLLRKEAERISRSASFGSLPLLQDKSGSMREYLIGIHNDDDSKISVRPDEFAVTEFNLNVVDSTIINTEEARLNLGHIDEAIKILAKKRAEIGSYQARINTAVSNLETKNLNESSAQSQMMDADIAYETAEKIRSEGKLKAASSVLSQSAQFSAMTLKLLKD